MRIFTKYVDVVEQVNLRIRNIPFDRFPLALICIDNIDYILEVSLNKWTWDCVSLSPQGFVPIYLYNLSNNVSIELGNMGIESIKKLYTKLKDK